MRVSKSSLKHPSRLAAVPVLRLPAWQRRGFYGVCGLLSGSGLAWLAAHFIWPPVTAFGAGVSAVEPWSMKLHGAAAMFALWLVGTMLQLHIRRGLAARRNLSAGWAMLILLALLSLSGYALYYIADESSRPFWSATHWVIGLLMPAVVWLHVRSGRKAQRS